MRIGVGGVHEGGDIAIAKVPLICCAIRGGVGESRGIQEHRVGEVRYRIEIACQVDGAAAMAPYGVGNYYREVAGLRGFYALGGGSLIP